MKLKALVITLAVSMLQAQAFAVGNNTDDAALRMRNPGGRLINPGIGPSNPVGRPGLGREATRVRLQVDSHTQGHHTLFLKQMIHQQSRVNLQDYKIDTVRLLSKSQMGRGNAGLEINGQIVDNANIPGSPNEFFGDRPASFYAIELRAPNRGQQNGTWQIELQGNIKVKTAVVMLTSNVTNQQIELYLDNHLQGQNDLGLKMLINQQYGRSIDVQDLNLDSVIVVGKSKMGHGTVELVINGLSQDIATLGGNPPNFNRPGGMDRVNLNNYRPNANGQWRLLTSGNIKIQKLVLNVSSEDSGRNPGHGGGRGPGRGGR